MISEVIAASDLAGQFWCEMQVDLRRRHGAIERKEMRRGKEIHKDLLLEVTDVIPVSPRTPVDELHMITGNILAGMKLFKETGVARELPVFFRFESVFIRGVLDEIQMVKVEGRDSKNRRRTLTKTRVIETKTRNRNVPPYSEQLFRDKMQGMIYWYGLNSMIEKRVKEEDVYSAYGIDLMEFIGKRPALSVGYMKSLKIPPEEQSDYGSGLNVAYNLDEALEAISRLPKLSDTLELRYIHQDTKELVYREEYKFDSEFFDQKMKWALDYWLGRRDPVPVGERNKWKCNFCNYQTYCPVVE